MIGKKIKIALCLSGEPRNSMFCFPYISESFLVNYPQFEIDTYIHTFKNYRAINLYNPVKLEIEYKDENKIYKSYTSKYGINFVDLHNTPFRNTFLMHYGIDKCFELTSEVKYDYYIRCRPDIMFHSRLDLNYIISSLEDENKDIWIPHSYDNSYWKHIINDQLAVGNFKAIKAYSNTVYNLKELVDQVKSYYPEELLLTQLKNNNIKIKYGYTHYSLLRKIMLITHPEVNTNAPSDY